MKSLEEILKKQIRLGHEYPNSISYNTAIDAMIEYGDEIYNKAIDDASSIIKTLGATVYTYDVEQLILKLKK